MRKLNKLILVGLVAFCASCSSEQSTTGATTEPNTSPVAQLTDEQKVILAAKNLYQKLKAEKDNFLVVDWYKDEQPRKKVFSLIQISLNNDLPESYDRVSFLDKTNLLMNHFIDMAVQGYGWVSA